MESSGREHPRLFSFGRGPYLGQTGEWAFTIRPSPPLTASTKKGSLPIQRIRAHKAKIYGIDWAHDRRNELVTCSLDKTIKIWDTQTATTNVVIDTSYPVWRARDLPFGQGVLSLPQRGETALEMYAHEDPTVPIEKFEGHTDVVKEFVWRRGGQGQSLLESAPALLVVLI